MKYGRKLRWPISRSAALGPTAGGSSSAKLLGAAGFVQLLVDAPCRLRRHAGHALELLRGRGEHLLDRTEVIQQRAPPRRADALEVVEDRREPARLAALAMEPEREPVSLVA